MPEAWEKTGVRSATLGLTRAMVDGNEEAFRQFHRVYFDRLLRYLLVVTRGDDQAARDALQETFLRVVRHVRPFDREPVFWSWLTVLARSAARDGGRQQSRYRRLLARFARMREKGEAPGAEEADERLQQGLAQGLMGLAAVDRKLVEGKYLRKNSVKELAKRFDLSEKAVESRLLRARRQMQEALKLYLNRED